MLAMRTPVTIVTIQNTSTLDGFSRPKAKERRQGGAAVGGWREVEEARAARQASGGCGSVVGEGAEYGIRRRGRIARGEGEQRIGGPSCHHRRAPAALLAVIFLSFTRTLELLR